MKGLLTRFQYKSKSKEFGRVSGARALKEVGLLEAKSKYSSKDIKIHEPVGRVFRPTTPCF
jgi:hypothetical protein